MELVMGVEGGSTASKAIILNRSGHIVSHVTGPPTNINLFGADETAKRIKLLLVECLKRANISIDSRINYLGLSLSGIDTEINEINCKNAMKNIWQPGIDYITVCNDTVGALRTAADAGIVLISGTGSNCRLIHSNLTYHRVGGWGNLLGDEGSAYGLVKSGIKKLIDSEEGKVPSEFSCNVFHDIVLKYLQIANIYDLIPVFYQRFDKAVVANMCPLIGQAAESGDAFCKNLFHEAGFELGRLVATMARHCEPSILNKPEGLSVVCVGGVWGSWNLLKEGFLCGLKPIYKNDITINRICLKKLIVTAAYGAAIIGSELGGSPILPDYSSTSCVFYHL